MNLTIRRRNKFKDFNLQLIFPVCFLIYSGWLHSTVFSLVSSNEADAETIFEDSRKGRPTAIDKDDFDEHQSLNSTERIVNDKGSIVSSETASLLFNDGHSPASGRDCGGVCIHPSTCLRLGGKAKNVCTRNGGVCCIFDRTCNQMSKELVSFFHSPGYPAPTVGTLICQFDIVILPGVCGIRLEFQEFNTTRPLDRGLCNIDQFLILNSLDGAAFPRCGELSGYTTIIPVDARQRVPLTLLSIIQSSRETFKWNIKVTQMKCDLRQVSDYPGCGKKYASADAITPPNNSQEEVSDVENSIPNIDEIERRKNSELSSSYIDNAFYVEYLKQTHAAVYDGPSPNPNQTLCKNSAIEIAKEKFAIASALKNVSTTTAAPPKKDDSRARIIRGNDTELFEFPWQVSIHDKKGHVCGGAILNEYSILTASHCFMSVAPVVLRHIKIILGDLNLNTTKDTNHVEMEVHSVLFHSHFDPYYLKNDIALIRLRKPIQFRAGIQPVCLPERSNSYVGKWATISGWGAINFPLGKLAQHLQKVKNEIIENSECKRILKIDYIYPTMMCAVAPKCAGTCFGDSGGPLVVESTDEVSRLVGIVSFGIGGCALLPYWPDVYTRVNAYLDWLAYAIAWV